MEQLGLKQSDIAEVIGGKNRASEIINRKRDLTAKMMSERSFGRDLHKKFNIPAESLLA
jgi:HTH-type transcriptional regulator/antitoxin HigA